MRRIGIRQAKAQFSRLIGEAADGKPFIITRAGKPLVKVLPLDRPKAVGPRIGFMKGQVKVPLDFDDLGRDEVMAQFGDEEPGSSPAKS